jgi:arylsulfatase A-like enzyme
METDWAVGQVVEAVERAGIADKTLIIVTADNGCSNMPLKMKAVKNPARFKFLMGEKSPDDPEAHYPSDIYRGHKADIYEGGHRVPFIARWDGKVKPGSVSAETVCQVDLFATCAEIVGAKPDDSTAEDSVSILPALLGTATKPVREAVVHHSIDGSFAIRQGKWKLALCPGSGGWSHPSPPSGKKKAALQEPIKDWVQLFDLEADPAETKNLASKHPEIVANLTALLQKYIDAGRSTPGAPQKNNGETFLYPQWIQKGRQTI